MRLVVVESPAKARTIQKYLKALSQETGDEYVVRASMGHIRDLPKNNRDAVDIEGGFIPRYVVAKGKEKVVRELKALATKANKVVLATDPDREGEAIAWHIAELLDLPPERYERVVFHEITKDAVGEAFRHPRSIDEHLRLAQEARRVLDRIVGYDLSGLLWKKVRYGLSAGRVQSPALRILVEREREIRAFVPQQYFVLTAHTQTPQGESLAIALTKEPASQEEVEVIAQKARESEWVVVSVEAKEESRAAPAPFITSTLQQAASSRLGFTPVRTMRAAQALYEAGHITYMRTDSPTLSEQALRALEKAVISEFGKEYHETHQFRAKSKTAQEAHEAIRPTNPSRETAGATEDQRRLYALIRSRALASQMRPARVERLRICGRASALADLAWCATGSRVVFPGWLAADPAARGEDMLLPKVSEGAELTLHDVAVEEKWTQPPRRYTEAGLIRELEKRGIGRPSTYAAIIETLFTRRYVERDGRSLKPTLIGEVVSGFLEEHFPRYISDTFTAEMEEELDEIARGEREYRQTLEEFYASFAPEVLKKEKTLPKQTTLGPAPEEFPCPRCGASMVYKLTRGGRFMSCSRYPECEGARAEDGSVLEASSPLGTDPASGLPVYVLSGPYGWYVQLGETPPKGSRGAPKPKRVSLPPDVSPSSLTLEKALALLSFPRELGKHPQTGEPVTAHLGRFGPYVACGKEFRSLKDRDPSEVTLHEALELLAQPPASRRAKRRS
ncbi:MAG: DNA topoisomerase 1 [Candidatus Parcubacteria bacterium]|nr:MAG: DNA topoisomerase 1 [Candidatus Parcubacteria bacterium]